MGKRGPQKQPTALKVLHGERKASRLNHAAPKPRTPLTMPKGMSRAAQAVWRRQVKAFEGLGILTAADADSLRAYSEAVVRYEAAASVLEEQGPLVRGATGLWVKNPLHQIVRDNAQLVRQFGRELGFLPSARESLTTKDEKDADPFEAWQERKA